MYYYIFVIVKKSIISIKWLKNEIIRKMVFRYLFKYDKLRVMLMV